LSRYNVIFRDVYNEFLKAYKYIKANIFSWLFNKHMLVTLPHPLFNSIVAEVIRWNDVICNIRVQATPLELELGA
jgi:hypothetical protein